MTTSIAQPDVFPADQPAPASSPESEVSPVSKQERIYALDALRGFAVLGILLMNIVDFGLPGNAYIDPSVAGGDRGLNLAAWFANQIFFEGKMRAIFSMLFGAGAILLLTRGEERDQSLRPADIYYRRTMWLILFGILHAYLIWWGDILYPYGVIGLFLFPLRKAKPKWLLTIGVILLLVVTGIMMAQRLSRIETREKGLAAQKAAAAGQTLTEEQQEDKKEWEEFLKEAKPGPKELQEQIDAHRGSYWSVLKWRAGKVAEGQSTGMYFFWIYDAGGMMLIGMALLGLGVLTAQRSRRFYWTLVLVGYGVGGAINAFTGYRYWKTGFDPIEGMAGMELGYAIGRLLVALAHISVLMLIVKAGWLKWLTSRLASCGQMALSCYLASSVICSTFFYGYGFGMYAKLQRYQLLYVVFAVWLLLLIVSPIWLSRFRFGPMEWVWRSLTYWKKQPMKMNLTKQVAVLTLTLCLLSSPLSLKSMGAQEAGRSKPDFSELEAIILNELKETKTPGAAIGIVSGERLIYAKGFGVSNVETGALVTPEMLFRLGSTTKMFTAAAAVRLAEEGKLKLNEPVGKYAKGLNSKVAQLSVGQMLSHTAGLKDEAIMFGLHDDTALGATVRAIDESWLYTAPGKIYSYSNPGYWLAGYVIEEVSGKTYADQMELSLFKPLGMASTTLRPTMAMTRPLSQGHDVSTSQPKVIRPMADNAGNWPAGSMFSSVADLSRFVIAFMNGGRIEGNQVFSTNLIAELSSPRVNPPGSPGSEDKYGYGLALTTTRGVKLVEHGGSRSGYGSRICMAPDQRIAVIILVNKTGGSLPKTVEKALELTLPLTAKANNKPTPLPLAAAEIDRYVGRYGFTEPTVEVSAEGGKLILKQGKNANSLVKIAENRFRLSPVDTGPSTEYVFVMGENGSAEFLHQGGRSLKRLTK